MVMLSIVIVNRVTIVPITIIIILMIFIVLVTIYREVTFDCRYRYDNRNLN